MAAKKADMGSRAVNAVAGMAAAFVARKLLTFAWTKVTGKEPPDSPEDPQVALGEALAWGVADGRGGSGGADPGGAGGAGRQPEARPPHRR